MNRERGGGARGREGLRSEGFEDEEKRRVGYVFVAVIEVVS